MTWMKEAIKPLRTKDQCVQLPARYPSGTKVLRNCFIASWRWLVGVLRSLCSHFPENSRFSLLVGTQLTDFGPVYVQIRLTFLLA